MHHSLENSISYRTQGGTFEASLQLYLCLFLLCLPLVPKMSLPVVLLSQVWGTCAQSESSKGTHSPTGQIIEQ